MMQEKHIYDKIHILVTLLLDEIKDIFIINKIPCSHRSCHSYKEHGVCVWLDDVPSNLTPCPCSPDLEIDPEKHETLMCSEIDGATTNKTSTITMLTRRSINIDYFGRRRSGGNIWTDIVTKCEICHQNFKHLNYGWMKG